MDYRRFISYLYSYVDGEKGVNVGYIRCEQRHGICRFTLNVQDRHGIEDGKYKVYLYKMNEEGIPIGYYLEDMTLHGYCGDVHKQTNSQNVWNSGNRIEDFDGVIAIYDANHMYVSQWTDERLETNRFMTKQEWGNRNYETSEVFEDVETEKELNQTSIQEDKMQADIPDEPMEPDILDEPSQSNVQEKQTPTISGLTIRLMENRPKLPDFENHEIYDCVRIEPNDIGLLEMENWRLGVNSFLTHGFYNYKYLMLGKLRFQDGVVKAVLGVPGVYDNKEQYIAKIFGFEVFVPVKHTNVKTGNFGYWIVELA